MVQTSCTRCTRFSTAEISAPRQGHTRDKHFENVLPQVGIPRDGNHENAIDQGRLLKVFEQLRATSFELQAGCLEELAKFVGCPLRCSSICVHYGLRVSAEFTAAVGVFEEV